MVVNNRARISERNLAMYPMSRKFRATAISWRMRDAYSEVERSVVTISTDSNSDSDVVRSLGVRFLPDPEMRRRKDSWGPGILYTFSRLEADFSYPQPCMKMR